jgi:Tfp pilus assembly major pilin PilA
MSRTSKNQEGFTLLEALLIILILVVIGAVGYVVYHNDHKTNKVSVSAVDKSSVSSKAASGPYSGWNNYRDTSGWFTLQYPTTWANDTAQAGSTVSEGPSQAQTTLSSNGQGELTPSSFSKSGPDLLTVSTNTYSGTVQAYLENNSGSTTQNKDLTINGYQAHYGVGTNSGGNTYDTYLIFNQGKVAILNFLVTTPTSFGGDAAQNYSQYSSVEAQIAKSIHFID